MFAGICSACNSKCVCDIAPACGPPHPTPDQHKSSTRICLVGEVNREQVLLEQLWKTVGEAKREFNEYTDRTSNSTYVYTSRWSDIHVCVIMLRSVTSPLWCGRHDYRLTSRSESLVPYISPAFNRSFVILIRSMCIRTRYVTRRKLVTFVSKKSISRPAVVTCVDVRCMEMCYRQMHRWGYRAAHKPHTYAELVLDI